MLSTLAVRLTSVGVPPNSLLAPDRSCILNRAEAASQQDQNGSRELLHCQHGFGNALAAMGASQGSANHWRAPGDTGYCGRIDQDGAGQSFMGCMNTGCLQLHSQKCSAAALALLASFVFLHPCTPAAMLT